MSMGSCSGNPYKVILDAYFGDNKGYQLVKHQIDSFNDFTSNKIEDIINGFNPIDVCTGYSHETGLHSSVISINVRNPTLSKPIIYEKDGSTKIMTPNDARLRNMTYAANLTVDLFVTAKTLRADNSAYSTESKRIKNVNLGKVPIMVRSNCCTAIHNVPNRYDECMYDYGGYFIVNGNEKVVISQDRIAENRTYVFVNNLKTSTCYSHIAEVRSVNNAKFGVPKTSMLKLSAKADQFGRCIRVSIYHIRNDIPLFIVFRALGVLSDADIVACILDGVTTSDLVRSKILSELTGCANEAKHVRTQEEAIAVLYKYVQYNAHWKYGRNTEEESSAKKARAYDVYRRNFLMNVLQKDVLPHVGNDPYKKAMYLGYMTNKLLRCYLKLYPFDDRDSYINKRLDTAGILISSLFRQYYCKVVKDMRNLLMKDVNSVSFRANKLIDVVNKMNVSKLVKQTILTSGLKYAMSTGNWGVKTTRVRQGVAQVLSRYNYISTMSHLRRISTPIEKTGKLIQPRKLHPTQWGIVCPSETPEGASVGLVKNLSLLTSVTVYCQTFPILDALKELDLVSVYDIDMSDPRRYTKVFVNGDIIGYHLDPASLRDELVGMKRSGGFHMHTSISWNVLENDIYISSEGGRFVRPLIVVDAGNKVRMTRGQLDSVRDGGLSWTELINCGVVEYLDVEESNHSLIAMTHNDLADSGKDYTHLEIDPSVIFGIVAGSIPFSDHNQAPRNTYQSAMGKQAIGVYTSNYRHRLDTMTHVLNYPQAPLVSTHTSRIMNCDKLPCGMNVIVAIGCFTGFNQEDSVIINKSAIDRGLFTSTFFRMYREQNNKNHSTGEEEFFCKPDPLVTRNIKPFNYSKLSQDGFVPENTFVCGEDIIMGRCMPQKQKNSIVNKDTSVPLKSNEQGFIERNYFGNRYFTNYTGDGYVFSKVSVRNERIPAIGDKLSSRHGQKGTIGMIYTQENLPFTKDGIIPDIIINPHAIPSRMTIGQLFEAIESKNCAFRGTRGDASPFNGRAVDDICRELLEVGSNPWGDEIMYTPRTGEQVSCPVFVCPTYYQRLKHMVEDKVHSRAANGPVVLLTRQPAEGRARDGGLRLGEMELECMWAHGTMFFLKERFMECSDNYRVFVCRECGMVAHVNPERDIYHCRFCKNINHFDEIRIPYACKLLFQEIHTMGIATRFVTDNPTPVQLT